MKVGKYLKEKQNIVYQTFFNAFNTNHLSHAYLLVGEQGTPLLESAIYLAKSLVCDHPSPLACEECLTCLRIDEGNYADIIVVDGATKTIKKEDVESIESRFSSSALESKGIMIYIINHVENMAKESINALLKFLEEPHENIFAFLTCENINRVLPTIVSRSQILHFKSIDKKLMKDAAINLGVPSQDAELLCNFYNNEELIVQKVEDKEYQLAKKSLLETIDAFNNFSTCLVFLHSKVFPNIKSKEAARYYLDMLTIFFQDLTNVKINNDITLNFLKNTLKLLSEKLPHIEQSFLAIMTCRSQIEMNINSYLLFDHLFNYILEGVDSNGRD